jgi:hypothetical protein
MRLGTRRICNRRTWYVPEPTLTTARPSSATAVRGRPLTQTVEPTLIPGSETSAVAVVGPVTVAVN